MNRTEKKKYITPTLAVEAMEAEDRLMEASTDPVIFDNNIEIFYEEETIQQI